MQIYSGLEQHQAIKCNDKYVVQLGYNNYEWKYEVNGVQSRGGRQIVVDDLSEIKRYVQEQKKTIGAIISDGSEVPVETIQQFNAKYSQYEDEDGRMWFDEDTEAELQYVKDKAYYRVQEYVYETTPAYTEDLEITVVGSVEDTGSDFIETPYVYGKANFGSSGVYRVNLSRIAMDELCKVRAEYPNVVFDLPKHNHLKYVKVDTQYVFTNRSERWINDTGTLVFLNDLEQAHEKEREIRKFVRGMLETYAAPRKAGDIEIKDFVESLRSIKTSVEQLDVKQKSRSGYMALLKTINDKIGKYTQG